MDNSSREEKTSSKKPKAKKKSLKFFYLNGMLHRKLLINRGADQIITWCYPLEKRVAYTYSFVLKEKKPAFTTKEVSAMLNRSMRRFEVAFASGWMDPPQYAYNLETKNRHSYQWSEEDVIEMHKYFQQIHRGRPRNDGIVTPQKMPSLRELRAMMRNESIMYIKDEDGEFKPVWAAQDFS